MPICSYIRNPTNYGRNVPLLEGTISNSHGSLLGAQRVPSCNYIGLLPHNYIEYTIRPWQIMFTILLCSNGMIDAHIMCYCMSVVCEHVVTL